MASTDSAASPSSVNPSEVGWQFVPQYYNFVNKEPHRLHCFYNKASTVTHGVEGEDVKPCFGQQEIHDKIASIGFQDCKVFIHSVDAQSSTNGGIILQVIGEMSNHGDPWRKFVQTFFLAEQAGGYFVLNDIFRFLREDVVDDEEAYPEEAEPESSAVPSAEATQPPAEAPVPVREPSPAPTPQPVEEPTTVAELPPSEPPAPQTNGVHKTEPAPEPEPVPTPPAEQPPAPVVAPPSPAPPTPQPPAEPPAPIPAPVQPPPPAQPAAPAAPPAPKTWANLAAANSKKWGANVAQESRGTSEAPPPVVKTPSQSGGTRGQQQQRTDGSAAAASNITTPQCFVKNVLESVTQVALTTTLTTRFGPVKDVEIVRNKACAFLEFATLDAAKRAITASLPVDRGGEGGIRVDVGDGAHVRILVETKKERGERPTSRPRGGPPNGDGGRGGFRGRGGPGRGRGSKQ